MNSSLPVFSSKEYLSIRLKDYFNTIVYPSICAFGMLTSIACLIASHKKIEPNNKFLNYIFIISLADLVFFITQFFSVLIRCGVLCPFGYDYFSKLYEIQVFWFVAYSLVNSQAFLSIFIAYDRLRVFATNRREQKFVNPFQIYACCLVIAALFNLLPYALSKNVVAFGIYQPQTNGEPVRVLYQIGVKDAFNTPLMLNVTTICLAIKDPFMYVVVCFLNILVCIRFRSFMHKKKSLLRESTSLFVCLFFFCLIKK